MAAKACSDADFIELFETIGPQQMSSRLGVRTQGIFERRRNLEKKIGRKLVPKSKNQITIPEIEHPDRIQISCLNGVVLVGSDAHIWPGPPTTAMRAFLKFAKELKPRAVVMNGDVVDLPQISRHPRIGWDNYPSVVDELKAAQDALIKLEGAVQRNTKLVWTLGNHDSRFETRLAMVAPEYAKLFGFHLKDHFPKWDPCWAVWVNNDVVIKHRFKGGIHAAHNNAVNSGKSMITGHLHSAKISPWTDYNGTRYGVDTGCLADPDAEAFLDYTEDNPKNWRSGFLVLTFVNGKLLPPELVSVWTKNSVVFRGKIIGV